jgi:alginate O-acetyltransferase complex protein AlgI
MSFISWQYLLFLPAFFLVYWLLPARWRLPWLLAASYFFYACWDVRFLALVFASTAIDYVCGLSVGGLRLGRLWVLLLSLTPAAWLLGCYLAMPSAGLPPWLLGAAALLGVVFCGGHEVIWQLAASKRAQGFLILSVCFCLAILGFFKYFNFFIDSAKSLLALTGLRSDWTLLKIILPVGISFYTFQSLGYVIDVYRGQMAPCRDFLTFATFDAFFPQMVSGPIERARHLIPQLQSDLTFSETYVQEGLQLILVGLFKKIFVADNCAILANHVFDPHTTLNGYWAVLGVVAFAFQIYGDFSGYTDIARGSAKFLGINLAENFKFPYLARTPADFWGRWHITLSAWFRDYLYIPLGGNRGTKWNTLRNLAVVMVLAGLWHGASWIFVLWGVYHGVLLIMYRIVTPLSRLEPAAASPAWRGALALPLMLAFTLVGWAIFRSPNLAHLGAWFGALGRWDPSLGLAWQLPALWLLLHTVPLVLLQILTRKPGAETALEHVPWAARGLVYTLLLLLVISSAAHDQEFIYFQF